MAELYIIGQIVNAVDFVEPNLFCKWSIQFGSSWKNIEGAIEGQTITNSFRFEEYSTFSQPIDCHLACRGLQGYPKIHVEVCAVNALKQFWPVGFGFAHIPTQSGTHKIEIPTWKIAPGTFLDTIKDKFHGGGFTISKSDLVYSGIERYKLCARSSGTVNVELMLIFKNFTKYGVELN